MQTLEKTKRIFAMDKENPPAIQLSPGEKLTVQTCDCFTDVIETEQDLVVHIDFEQINPASGPIYIEGAEPGDVLKVNIEKITLDEKAVMVTSPGFGLLGEDVQETVTKVIPIKEGKAELFGLQLPLRPMIGVIGTAPMEGRIETGTPGAHGGNMDCRRITQGSSLYLPVHVEGALLSLGDLHALMGDGEICVCGAEIAGEVVITTEVLKNSTIPTPSVETEEVFAAIYSADTMEEASKGAARNLLGYLQEETDLSFSEAYMLLSATGTLAVCQVVDPKMTMRMEIPREILEELRERKRSKE